MRARLVAVVVCALVGPAGAEPNYEIAASAGVVSTDADAAITSVAVSRHLPYRFVAGVELAGFTATADAMHVMVVPALARGSYCIPWRRGELWAGGGAGAAFASYAVAQRAVVPVEAAFAGLSARVGAARITFETSYVHATLHDMRIGGATASLGVAFGI